ncbi:MULTISPECIES: hypothetical protein [unclassified Massilia]|uniref:hypothetical protein n=1 Tax=unclassified Massilia TaxID=2609279 RepID=UPI001AED3D16|nr:MULTISPECIES: hypothetical protein [unclassified Massilia]
MLVDETPVADDMPIASFHAAARARASAATAPRPGGIPADDQVFNVRLADSPRDRGQARVLLDRMYAWRGYASEGATASIPIRATGSRCTPKPPANWSAP